MIHIRSKDEIEIIRENAMMVTATLTEVAKFIRAGTTTKSIDEMAYEFIKDHGGEPSFLGYGGFPASLCISVNDVVVHGIPSAYQLKDGDIVSIDCGFNRNGYHGDHAYTFGIGNVKPEILTLMRVTKESLALGVAQARAHNRVGDVAYAIEHYTSKVYPYGVVRELVGHGVGKKLHEDPQVPNFGKRGDGKKLKEHSVIAIEPMINLGTKDVYTKDDGWTVVTADGKPSAHYEHTTLVGRNSGIALSDFGPIEAAERANPELTKGHLQALELVAA